MNKYNSLSVKIKDKNNVNFSNVIFGLWSHDDLHNNKLK